MSTPPTGGGTAGVTDLEVNDVLLGRGLPVVKYEGNVRFRQLILEKKAAYSASSRHADKDRIARWVIQEIQNRGGRFLRRIESAEEATALGVPVGARAWKEVDARSAREKVKQAFRDHNHLQNKDARAAGATVATMPPIVPNATSSPQPQLPNPEYQRLQEEQRLALLQRQALLQQAVNGTGVGLFGGSNLPPQLMGYMPSSHQNLALLQQLQLQRDQQRQQLLTTLLQQQVPLQQMPPALSESVPREIPNANQNLLPLVLSSNSNGVPQFTSNDASLLLLARDSALQCNDAQRLTQANAVLNAGAIGDGGAVPRLQQQEPVAARGEVPTAAAAAVAQQAENREDRVSGSGVAAVSDDRKPSAKAAVSREKRGDQSNVSDTEKKPEQKDADSLSSSSSSLCALRGDYPKRKRAKHE